MRRILTAITAIALAFSLVAQATPANALVPGYDSRYVIESAFLPVEPGGTVEFTVTFQNMGTVTWVKGTETEVVLAACLEDKVTCPAQDPDEALWQNATWESAVIYAEAEQTSVAPGGFATFTYSVTAPANAAPGRYRFNGDLMHRASQQMIHPQGYYQEAVIEEPVAVQEPITVTPATGTNQLSDTHEITITIVDENGDPVADELVDVFVVDSADAMDDADVCDLRATAGVDGGGEGTGTECTIDAGDPITDENGQLTVDITDTATGDVTIFVWTGTVGDEFDSDDATFVTVTKTWIEAVSAVDATPNTALNQFGTSHTVTATIEDDDGDPVRLAGEEITFNLRPGCGTAVTDTETFDTDADGQAEYTFNRADPSATTNNADVTDCVDVFYDRTGDGDFNDAGESETVTKTWSDDEAAPTTLDATPEDDGNPVSTRHTVTATLVDQFGEPVAGETIIFTIRRGTATPTQGAATTVVQTVERTTNTSGTVTFSYVGPASEAYDEITACLDENDDDVCDAGVGPLTDVIEKSWAGEAQDNSQTTNATVRACDEDNNAVYASGAGDNPGQFRFDYDEGDNFTVDGTPTTLEAFEDACSDGDSITIFYNDDGVSSFALTNEPAE